MAVNLSGRDIADICKQAERKWASRYIRKQVTQLEPAMEVYIESTESRLRQMGDTNLRMDHDFRPDAMAAKLRQNPLASGQS